MSGALDPQLSVAPLHYPCDQNDMTQAPNVLREDDR